MTTRKRLAEECLKRAKMAYEQGEHARKHGDAERVAYLLGVEHAYTATYYQILSNTFGPEGKE